MKTQLQGNHFTSDSNILAVDENIVEDVYVVVVLIFS